MHESITITSPIATAIDASMYVSTSTISTAGSFIDLWSLPEQLEMVEYPDRLEIIYKEKQLSYYSHSITGVQQSGQERVFKIVYSCVNGQFHKSEKIYVTIVPPR
jgi:hypothetical protein